MKRHVSLLATLMIGALTGCTGDSHEKMAAESMTTMKDLTATLETVKDQASAKAAKPKLTSLAEKMKKLNERQAKLPAPSEADRKALESRHGKEMGELQGRLAAVMMRIQFDPAIQAELKDIDFQAK